MFAQFSSDQENWTMLAVMFAVMAGVLLLKWRIVNSARPISFIAFLKQLLSG